MNARNKIVVIGSYEQVAEVSMLLLREPGVGSFMSEGIRELHEQNNSALPQFIHEINTRPVVDGIGALIQRISDSCFGAYIGTSIASDSPTRGRIFWAASYCLEGNYTKVRSSFDEQSLPRHISSQVVNHNNYGSIPEATLHELHELAIGDFISSAKFRIENKVGRERLSLHGFPHWSLITHSAFDRGLDGLTAALKASDQDPLAHLLADAKASKNASIASWMDAVLSGSRASSDSRGEAFRAPYSTLDVADIQQRAGKILSFFGGAVAGAPLAEATASAITMRGATLHGGEHPMVWLCRANPGGRLADVGMAKLIARLAAQPGTSTENETTKVIKAIAISGYQPMNLRLALNFVSPETNSFERDLHARNCINIPLQSVAPAQRAAVAEKLIDAWVNVRGSILNMSTAVSELFARAGEAPGLVFAARLVEAQMCAAIATRDSELRPSPVPVNESPDALQIAPARARRPRLLM